ILPHNIAVVIYVLSLGIILPRGSLDDLNDENGGLFAARRTVFLDDRYDCFAPRIWRRRISEPASGINCRLSRKQTLIVVRCLEYQIGRATGWNVRKKPLSPALKALRAIFGRRNDGFFFTSRAC